jgi:chromosome segregation ATPase
MHESARKFATLEKALEHEIQLVRKELNPYLNKRDMLQEAVIGLNEEMENEKKHSRFSDDISLNVDNYIEGYNFKLKMIAQEINDLNVKIKQFEDTIFDLYQDMQKYSVLKQRRIEAHLAEIDKQEDELIDEVGANLSR